MYALETIHKVNNAATERELKETAEKLRTNKLTASRLLDMLEVGLEIDFIVGRDEEVMAACSRMADIAFKCAEKLLERRGQ